MAVRLALLRHGATPWNREGRLQGRSDIALDAQGRDAVANWRLPTALAGFAWVSSPLARARQTAEILAASFMPPPAIAIELRLTEMRFGDWEGENLPALRAQLGPALAQREALGLDFAAPGGESPRQVQVRLRPWLSELAAAERDIFAVAHKGIIRAAYSLATGWTMTSKAPDKMRADSLQIFAVDDAGSLKIERLNHPLDGSPIPPAR